MAKSASASSEKKQTGKQGERRFKWLVIPLVILLFLGGALSIGAGVAMWKLGDYNYDNSLEGLTDEDMGITDDPTTPPDPDDPSGGQVVKGVTNIALFGIDSRNPRSFSGNSDAIMIISIDEIHNKIKLTSIMRDTLVNIPDKGWGKLNSAYGRGGAQLAIKTINLMFNMNVRDYAAVNIEGMADLIDAMGGIEIDVREAERKYANEIIESLAKEAGTKNDPIQKAGKQTLTGLQAVCWARIRHVATSEGQNNDFGRTDRQRLVMEQLFQKAMSAGVSQYPGMIKALLPYVQTSLEYDEILSLAGHLIGGITFEQMRIPQMEYVIDAGFTGRTGSSTVYYNLPYAGKLLRAFIYEDKSPAEFMAENGIDKTRWAG